MAAQNSTTQLQSVEGHVKDSKTAPLEERADANAKALHYEDNVASADVADAAPTQKNVDEEESNKDVAHVLPAEENDVANTASDDVETQVSAEVPGKAEDDEKKVIEEPAGSGHDVVFPVVVKEREDMKVKRQRNFKVVVKSAGGKMMQRMKNFINSVSSFVYISKREN